MDRLSAVRQLIETSGADGLILSFLPHIRWLSGFTGSTAVVFVGPERASLITDGRYREQAAREVDTLDVVICDSSPMLYLAGTPEWFAELGPVLVQGEHMSASDLKKLESAHARTVFQVEDGLLDRMISTKEDYEVDRIRGAQQITEEVFNHLLGWLRPGVTEQDVAAEIVYQHMRRGAERMSFDPIVASGPNGALPHARPGDRILSASDVVVLDFGCFRNGYASDMTRTIALGEWPSEALAVYSVVREAQEMAVAAARAGMQASELDAVARDRIAAAGYADAFSHSLGHGVGLSVHEWPRIGNNSDFELPDRAVVSVEPGIYIPGQFGIRIEDLVLLRRDGCANLTNAPHEPITI